MSHPDPLLSHASEAHPASPTERLHKLLSLEQGDLWVIVGYSAAIGILALVTPVAVQVLVNQVAFTVLLQPVVLMTLFVLLGWGLSAVLRMLQVQVVELLQQRLFVRTAADLALRLQRAQITVFERTHGSEIVSRFLDIVTLQKSCAGLLLDGLGIFLQSTMGLLVLAFYHPTLLAFDVALLACILLILGGLGRGGVATSITESRAKYAVVDFLMQVARRPLLYKSTEGAARVVAQTDALLDTYVEARRRHFRVVLRQIGGSVALQALGSAALLCLGGALVIAGQLTIGQLVAAEIIVSSVVAGIAKLGKHLESYYDLMASLDKLGHLEDLPEERQGGVVAPRGPGAGASVRLHDVTAGYGAGPALLQHVHLSLAPGEHVAIVGERGSGKSLLCDLLLGLRTPEHGFIEIDGQDLRDVSLDSLRSQVRLLRSPAFVAGTLADNLRGSRPEAAPPLLRDALQAVGLREELSAARGGLHAGLTSEGHALSSGQRRRLAVARILVEQPRLLLIDDGGVFTSEELGPLLAARAPWTVIYCAQTADPLAQRMPRRFFVRDGGIAAAEVAQVPDPVRKEQRT